MSSTPALDAPAPSHDAPPPPVQMVQLLAGFQVSQALYVAAKLDLATMLVDGPRSAAELAAAAEAEPGHVGRLLRTLASLGAFDDRGDGTYGLTPLGATLARGIPGSVRDLALTWMETHYAPFSRLLDGVRQGEPAATLHYGRPFFDWLGSSPEQVERFTGAMAGLTDGIKAQALAGYALPPGELVADVGGADGMVLTTLLAADPARRGLVLDLPHVVPAAQRRLEQLGLADRVAVVGGDFFAAVPEGGDAYLLKAVLHDWPDEECVAILRNCRRAVAPTGVVLVVEQLLDLAPDPVRTAFSDLNMLVAPGGRERELAEYGTLLTAAGFTLGRAVPTGTDVFVVEAFPDQEV
jgi:hypothetical protein